MKKKVLIVVVVLLMFTLMGCSSNLEEDSLYQVSTLQALIVGEYDGAVTADTLVKYGNTGLGTFDGLDGEMIVIDGKVYKARVDGTVTKVKGKETIPFANVAYIQSKDKHSFSFDMGYDGLKSVLNDLYKEENMPVVFRIDGDFKNIEFRSVPEQKKPYPVLTDVVKKQTVFFEEEISGSIVGFRFPAFMDDMNAVGYHLHFISDDRTKGGHLLGVESGDVEVTSEDLETFYVVFPDNLRDADLNVNKGAVEAVEKK